jgi:hypothetical protein
MQAQSVREKRLQLTTEEKNCMAAKIKQDRSDDNLYHLVDEWNLGNLDRSIEYGHLKRIRDDTPPISNGHEFWESYETKVNAALLSVTSAQYKCKAKIDCGRLTKPLNADKIPFITTAQSNQLQFNFQKSCYTTGSDRSTYKLNDHFQKHLQANGMILAPFSNFVTGEEQQRLNTFGDSSVWVPSETGGVWETLSKAVLEPCFQEQAAKKIEFAFSDSTKRETRLNPNFTIIKEVFEDSKKERGGDVLDALNKVRCAHLRGDPSARFVQRPFLRSDAHRALLILNFAS